MWARSIVRYPLRIPIEENRSIRPMAVTISGFRIGRLLTFRITSRITLRFLERPMAVTVPSTVEITVAMIAMDRDT